MSSLSFVLILFEVILGTAVIVGKTRIWFENGNVVCSVCGLSMDTLRREGSILASSIICGERLPGVLHNWFKSSPNVLNIFWSSSAATPNKSCSQLVPLRCQLLDLGQLVSLL